MFDHTMMPLRGMRVCYSVCIVALSLIVSHTNGMSYEEALLLARNNEVDTVHENGFGMMEAFRSEHSRAEASGDPVRLRNIKVNLSSLLLLFANKNNDPKTYRLMYGECAKLAQEVLDLDVSMQAQRNCFHNPCDS